jgi:hypothetical protein
MEWFLVHDSIRGHDARYVAVEELAYFVDDETTKTFSGSLDLRACS